MRTISIILGAMIYTYIMVYLVKVDAHIKEESWNTCETLKYYLDEYDLMMDMSQNEHMKWNEICEDVLDGRLHGN